MNQTKSRSGAWQLAQRRWLGYVVAGAALGATILARYALATALDGQSLPLLFIVPVALAAYSGGLGPTIAVTFAGAAAEGLLFVDRGEWGLTDLSFEISILLFIGAGILLSVTFEAMHRARARRPCGDGSRAR